MFEPGFLAFITLRFLDIIDILLVAFLMYYLYKLIRGTGALNIFVGIIAIYLIWWLVRLFEMELLTEILSQFISVGVLALIVVFQPEIRKFLLILGTRSFLSNKPGSFWSQFWFIEKASGLNINAVVNACEELSNTKTGALIVFTRENNLEFLLRTGELLDARVSDQLLESIFFKNSPLHDGAVIISQNRIKAARCVLPVSEKTSFPVTLGLRHRAGAGITEQSDALAVVVSEQTGRITFCVDGQLRRNIKPVELKEVLAREFAIEKGKGEEAEL
jgi:diadenylate cyclase